MCFVRVFPQNITVASQSYHSLVAPYGKDIPYTPFFCYLILGMIENKPDAANAETVHNIEKRIRDNLDAAIPVFSAHSVGAEEVITPPIVVPENEQIEVATVPLLVPPVFPEVPPILHTQIIPDAEDVSSQTQSRLATRWAKMTTPGLSLRARIRAVPVLGYAMAWVQALIKLPVTRYQQEVNFDLLQRKLALNEDKITQVNTRLSLAQSYVDERTAQFSHQLRHQFEFEIVSMRNALSHRISMLANVNADARLQELEGVKSASRLHAMDMLDIGSRLMKLEQIESARKLKHYAQLLQLAEKESSDLKRQFVQLSEQVAHMRQTGSLQAVDQSQKTEDVAHKDEDLNIDKAVHDQFFSDFEETFRGGRSEIKRRLEVYLPYVQEVCVKSPVQSGFQMIDVGCGRGEWLELMSDHGFSALGIDLNEQKVAACIDLGLPAKSTDAIAYLREQPAGSLSVVTGFHLIEHLPFEQLLALFDAALLALKPGGLLIFETPNPENILVGACSFYTDPTHLSPIVPAVAQFIAQQRGFEKAELLRLHPYPDEVLLNTGAAADQVLNRYLFGAQDYALLARK